MNQIFVAAVLTLNVNGQTIDKEVSSQFYFNNSKSCEEILDFEAVQFLERVITQIEEASKFEIRIPNYMYDAQCVE